MCIDDHLYKNVIEYVRQYGAYSAETFNIEECRRHISYNDLVSDDVLRRLLGLASYVVYDECTHNK